MGAAITDYTMIWEMARERLWSMALYRVVLLASCMRPAKPLTMLKGDAIPPTPGVSVRWHGLLVPEERPLRVQDVHGKRLRGTACWMGPLGSPNAWLL